MNQHTSAGRTPCGRQAAFWYSMHAPTHKLKSQFCQARSCKLKGATTGYEMAPWNEKLDSGLGCPRGRALRLALAQMPLEVLRPCYCTGCAPENRQLGRCGSG